MLVFKESCYYVDILNYKLGNCSHFIDVLEFQHPFKATRNLIKENNILLDGV